MNKKFKEMLALITFVCGGILGICCSIFDLSLGIRILDAIIVIVALILLEQTTTCPYCGKMGLSANPFRKQKDHCKKCGREMDE